MLRYSSCAGPRPPEGICQGMVPGTGREEEPYSASPGPWRDEGESEGKSESEGEDGDENEEWS